MPDKDSLHMFLHKSYLCLRNRHRNYRFRHQHKFPYHIQYSHTNLLYIQDLNYNWSAFLWSFLVKPAQLSGQRHWHSSVLFPVKTKSGLLHTPFSQQSGLSPSSQQEVALQGRALHSKAKPFFFWHIGSWLEGQESESQGSRWK